MMTDGLIIFLVHTFAAYRISILLVEDNGPYDVFDFIRMKAGIGSQVTSKGKVVFSSDRMIGRILLCVRCTSFYVWLVFFGIMVLQIPYFNHIMIFLAGWGLITMLPARTE